MTKQKAVTFERALAQAAREIAEIDAAGAVPVERGYWRARLMLEAAAGILYQAIDARENRRRQTFETRAFFDQTARLYLHYAYWEPRIGEGWRQAWPIQGDFTVFLGNANWKGENWLKVVVAVCATVRTAVIIAQGVTVGCRTAVNDPRPGCVAIDPASAEARRWRAEAFKLLLDPGYAGLAKVTLAQLRAELTRAQGSLDMEFAQVPAHERKPMPGAERRKGKGIDEEKLARGAEFIRRRGSEGPSVKQVAEEVGLSRGSWQKRYAPVLIDQGFTTKKGSTGGMWAPGMQPK